ncbi:MAG: glutamine amidotransferase [Christensenellales bacterium]
MPDEWPHFLGYNKTAESLQDEVVMTIGGDPFLAFGTFGKGRSAAFTSDCAAPLGTAGVCQLGGLCAALEGDCWLY